MTMPEEVNRMETDSIITLYFYQIATSSNEVAIGVFYAKILDFHCENAKNSRFWKEIVRNSKYLLKKM